MDYSTANNDFPSVVFPLGFQKVIEETNKSLSYPKEYIGASILMACSVALGTSVKLQFKKGWIEAGVLYMAIVGRAGSNKTHPLAFALDPIRKIDFAHFERYKTAKKNYDDFMSDKANKGQEKPLEPTLNKIILGDFTPEALTKIHSDNLKGICVCNDELLGFIKNFNRYSSGGEQEFWLSAWSGKSISIDRVSKEPIFIKDPFISVCGTIQTNLLEELKKGNRGKNGFLNRFLFVKPIYIHKTEWKDIDMDDAIINHYTGYINNILKLRDKESKSIPYSPEARKAVLSWQKLYTHQYNITPCETTAEIMAKMETYVHRFSLILEVMKYAFADSNLLEVSLESVEGAIKLVRYFEICARKAYGKESENEKTAFDNLDQRKKNLYMALKDEFSYGEALNIAESKNYAESSLKRFLYDKDFFLKLRQGIYQKKMIR
jgi:hypothetical protein